MKPINTALCHLCADEIFWRDGHWRHKNTKPRHPAVPSKAEEPNIAMELAELIEQAGLKVCICEVCSHQKTFGPCSVCWCGNKPK